MTPALSDAERAAVLRTTATARGLPNRFYTAADAAALERDSVLGATWTCIGFASDVAPGHARPVDLMGLPLMVVRDPGATLRVFHNVCRHRGHRLVSAPCALQGALRCPYHSWTYGYDGRLRGTPHIGGPGVHEAEGFERGAHGLVEVRSATWLDMIFVNLSGEAPPFDDHVAPLLARWQALIGPGGLGALRPASADERLELELAGNWKLAVENYCESYHLPWVHPGLNSYSRLEDHYNIVIDDWGAGQGSLAFEFSERAGISLPRFSAWPADRLKVAEYVAMFPNVLLGLQNDHAYAIHVAPLAPDRTRETVQIYYVGEETLGAQFASARDRLREGWRAVFLEDVGVCEGMQQGRASPGFDGGAFSPVLDVPTHAFSKWVAARLPVVA
ncbi:MAG: SRPBCC family protein [Gammaproteobacteria bacterium]|nr:SRPBCC family protein [Gammaproteobacteria bacterium]